MNADEIKSLQEKVRALREEKNAVLLVHNYQVPEIQEIADFIGDSLELCRKAQSTDADIIVFCGVDFMAETASILNPDRKVLLPNLRACCPMAAQLPVKTLLGVKAAHPGVPVVLYVNTLAEAKAECDVTCTSANAAQMVEKLGTREVIFGPDWNLGYYVSKRVPGVSLIPAPAHGFCDTHRLMGKGEEVLELRRRYPDAEILVHPVAKLLKKLHIVLNAHSTPSPNVSMWNLMADFTSAKASSYASPCPTTMPLSPMG